MFHDYENVEITDKMNLARKIIIDIFHQTTPTDKILELFFLNDYITMVLYNYDYDDECSEDLDRYIKELRKKILNLMNIKNV